MLFNFPQYGFTKTWDPRLDPPVRVTDIYKTSCAMPDPGLNIEWSPLPHASWHRSWPTVPERWPAKPPQNWESYFDVCIGVKDAAGAEFVVRVPYKRFAENRDWAKALDLNVAVFCTSEAMWRYNGPTYLNEHLEFAQQQEEAHTRALAELEDESKEALLNGDFKAADRWAAEYEAQQRGARGPTIVEVDEPDKPDEPLWAHEKFAAMQGVVSANRERKRKAAADHFFNTKRRNK